MTISAKIIEDSVAPNGKRITTFLLTYPRMIHSEFMTHRMFSRNASSSRAIPFRRIKKAIQNDMAKPLSFTENQPGMQGGSDLSPFKQWLCYKVWALAGHTSLFYSSVLNWLGAHKQYSNRLSEPHSHITVVCTATDYSNFFALRHHSAAQPEIQALAKKMWLLYDSHQPNELEFGEWHLPFCTYNEKDSLSLEDQIKVSVARCARTSYSVSDGSNSTLESDLKLYDRLLAGVVKHSSPAEHQATPLVLPTSASGNFNGWRQYRKTIAGENITEFNGPLG